jgi:5'-nucleotidase (lipoprotein e(P4) family)
MRRWVVCLIVGALCAGCGRGSGTPKNRENLQAVLWTQRSAEHDALTTQTFQAASRALDRALADSTWTAALEQSGNYVHLPPAVIVDLDETALDNSASEADLVRSGTYYTPRSWERWCLEGRATAMPGAVEFCEYAAEKRVAVFYITDRPDLTRDATRKNLAALGFPLLPVRECILTPGDGEDKSTRRATVARQHRILLLLGDQLGDFISDQKLEPEKRDHLVQVHRAYWGDRWFILPSDLYGDWERALLGYDSSLSDAERLRRKLELLEN